MNRIITEKTGSFNNVLIAITPGNDRSKPPRMDPPVTLTTGGAFSAAGAAKQVDARNNKTLHFTSRWYQSPNQRLAKRRHLAGVFLPA